MVTDGPHRGAQPAPTPEERERAGWRASAHDAEIPREFWDASLETLSGQAIDVVRAYLETDYLAGRALILAGETGTGKTTAAVAALRAVDYAGGFKFFPRLVRELLNPGWRTEIINASRTRRLVVWDDVGMEYCRPDGPATSLIEELVWERHGNRRPTILTTNLTPEQLRTRLSDRIVDRLRSWGSLHAITGPSLRWPDRPEP